jgi:hypothetical protein
LLTAGWIYGNYYKADFYITFKDYEF